MKETLKKIITTFGQESQVEMIIEECSEVILALQKYKRGLKDSSLPDIGLQKRLDDVHEEIADLSIMIEQARIIFDSKCIDEWVEFKLKRVEKRMADRLDNSQGVC